MDELELGTNEGTELGFPEGKVTRDGTNGRVLGTTLGAVDGLPLGSCDGTELG